MAEEHRCQEGPGHRLCANNCGLFGNHLCSKCFSASHNSPLPSPSSSSPPPAVAESRSAQPPEAVLVQSADDERLAPQRPGRCTACSKKVGILGFRCRCGATYCGVHRYPEQHGCGFDFKVAGREAIARANPVVKADKLHGRI